MSVRPILLLLSTLAAALAGCGSSPEADTGAAKPAAPVVFGKSLSGAPAAAAIIEAMDEADLRRLGVLLETPRSGPARWQGGRGHDLLVTPGNSFAGDHGPCREFSVDATRNAITDRWRGSACQQADRRWQVLR